MDKRRRNWLLALLIFSISSVLVARFTLYEGGACPETLSLASLAVGVAVWLVMTMFALRSDDRLTNMVGSVLVAVVVIILAPPFVAKIIDPVFTPQFCPPDTCALAVDVDRMVNNGFYDAAIQDATNCINETTDPGCETNCGCGMARAYFEQARVQDAERDCESAQSALAEAFRVNEMYNCDLDDLLTEREALWQALCIIPTATPTPTPTPRPPIAADVQILRPPMVGDNTLTLDVRVVEAGTNIFIPELQAEEFAMTVNGLTIDSLSVIETSQDEPSCIVASVDTSGSIASGVQQMKNAINKINENARDNDELGLILFADSVTVVQSPPSQTSLDAERIIAAGNTALWDGVSQAIESSKLCSSANRVVIVITDGADTASVNHPGDNDDATAAILADRANENQVRVCTIGVSSDDLQPGPLQILAERSGCEYLLVDNVDGIALTVQNIMGQVRAFYQIVAQNVDISGNSIDVSISIGTGEDNFHAEP